jgi:hypothetical protein
VDRLKREEKKEEEGLGLKKGRVRSSKRVKEKS